MEFVAAQTCAGLMSGYWRSQLGDPVTQMHATLGKARFKPKQTRHLVARAVCVGQGAAKPHVAAALSVHRPCLGKSAQRSPKPPVFRKTAGMQFRIAAWKPAYIGAGIGNFVGERGERRDLGSLPP